MNNDVEIIKGRLTLLFKRRPQTRYWSMLTNGTYDQTYSLFLTVNGLTSACNPFPYMN